MHDQMPPDSGTIITELLDDGPAGIERSAGLLRAGGLVAFGTETVYGLGADATNPEAVAAIYAAKHRPAGNPLIAHADGAEAAFAQVRANRHAERLAARFWPGPLTLVLPRHPHGTVCALAAAGLDTLGVRVPETPAAQALLRAVGRPIAAPSANPSGRVSPSTAAHVLAGLGGRIDAVLDCGPCRVGLESTILDLSGDAPRLLRPGGITLEQLEAEIGPVAAAPVSSPSASAGLSSPGQLASHYAPVLPLRLEAGAVRPGEALLAFGPPLDGAGLVWRLSDRRDLGEAASRLFAGLRVLDQDGRRLGLSGIAAMPIPRHGLGLAIADRLARAAAPRDHSGARSPR